MRAPDMGHWRHKARRKAVIQGVSGQALKAGNALVRTPSAPSELVILLEGCF
jgi:hypothetical protein